MKTDYYPAFSVLKVFLDDVYTCGAVDVEISLCEVSLVKGLSELNGGGSFESLVRRHSNHSHDEMLILDNAAETSEFSGYSCHR